MEDIAEEFQADRHLWQSDQLLIQLQRDLQDLRRRHHDRDHCPALNSSNWYRVSQHDLSH